MNHRDLQNLSEAYSGLYELDYDFSEGKVAWHDPKNPNPSGYTPKEKSEAKRKQLGVDDPNALSFDKGGPGEKEYARHANLSAAQQKMSKRGQQPKGKPHQFKKDPFWKKTEGQVNRTMFGTDVPEKKKSSYPSSVATKKEQVDLYDIVLSHLLDEGYADSPEAAEVMMVHMSEEWRESIVEATAMAKRGLNEPAIRQKIAASTGGGGAADRATSLENRPTYGDKSKEAQRSRYARAQRGDFRRTTSSSPGLHLGQHKSNDPAVKALQAARGAQRGVLTPAEKKQFNREEVDIYDIILSHLLDEGYAETPEAAEVMMVHMSEEWRDTIVYEVLDEGYKRFPYKKVANKLDKMYDDPDTDIRFGKDAKRYSTMKRVDSHMKGEVLRTDKREYSPKISKAKSKYNP